MGVYEERAFLHAKKPTKAGFLKLFDQVNAVKL